MTYQPWALAELTQRRPFVDTRCLVVIRRKLPSDRITVNCGEAFLLFLNGGSISVQFQEKEGLFHPAHVSKAAELLGWNVVGLLAIIAWTGTTSFIMFSILAKFQMLRVEHEHEFKGKTFFLILVRFS